jgi:hypothetical protein
MNEIKKIILEETLLVLLERDMAKERAEFQRILTDRLLPLKAKDKIKKTKEYEETFNKVMAKWDANWKKENPTGPSDASAESPEEKSIEDVAVDPLINQISWVVKNVFEPARIDKVLDNMFLEFAKEERGSFGSVGVKRLVSKYQDALKKIKKDVSNLMSKMVKESTVRSLSPYTVEVIKKTYEMFHKQ